MKDGASKTEATTGKTDGTVLVPPDGVHTPGSTAHGDGQPLVEVPADAQADPDATARAYRQAQSGTASRTGPSELANQNADGSAMTPAEHDQAIKAEREQAAQYGDPTAKPDGITK